MFHPASSVANLGPVESAPANTDSLTPSQRQAVQARGNVLVMAGAGTGKTKTLVARCLDCLARDGAALDELLIVTFTEAVAAEMRLRLRLALEARALEPGFDHQPSAINFWQEQLARFDLAHIGTLHSFCLKLVREHFYELGLDPRLAMLDEGESRQLAGEILEEQLAAHYAGDSEFSRAVQNLIESHGGGRDETIRRLIQRLHHYAQARPDAAGWLAGQRETFSTAEPAGWLRWLLAAVAGWRDEWLPVLESLKNGSEKAAELAGILSDAPREFSREAAAEMLEQVVAADRVWPHGTKTKLRPALRELFDGAEFLQSLAVVKNGVDPLAEDWSWVRDHMKTLLRLAEEFAQRLAERKRADGALDFHDLEQFALNLLWNHATGSPTSIAASWRGKLKFIFVDEYQDINAAQDKIIQGLSRSAPVQSAVTENVNEGVERKLDSGLTEVAASEDGRIPPPHPGNRFLVGDVKQSIYRFRLADPKIFRAYAKNWHGGNGETISLSENFRSREGILNFVNSLCRQVMREEIGGVAYDAAAELRFGEPPTRGDFSVERDDAPRAELLVRFKNGRNESRDEAEGDLARLDDAQREARLVTWRIKKLVEEQRKIFDDDKKIFRAVEWRDMAILLRSPRGKSEIFAQEFERAGVPLAVARGGFYQSAEILDLLSLLQLLDNPLQDVPCIAVLRSPFVGLSLDDLAEIRLAAKEKHFWTALNRSVERGTRSPELAGKVSAFLEKFSRWRKMAKQISLSQCLEDILAETLYADWLQAQPRGAQRAANVARFLQLAQAFDQFQQQGLFRFLKFIAAQQEAEAEPEVAAQAAENAVRLMSIHQSKGLEFPVVVLVDLAKRFNEQDLRGEIIFDEEFGLCPKVKPPRSGRRYPSLPHWLAQRRQKRELRGEELRLLYVALTRARDHLILTASVTEKNWEEQWTQPQPVTAQEIAGANSFADWLAMWFGVRNAECGARKTTEGELPELRWAVVTDTEWGGFDGSGRDAVTQTEIENRKSKIGNESAPPDVGGHAFGKLRERLEWNYPFAAATARKAKSSVTALRRAAEDLDDEAENVFPVSDLPAARRRSRNLKPQISNLKLGAAEIGAAHHKFMQYVTLDRTDDLVAEADRLTRQNYLTADERAVLDLSALGAFWHSPLGRQIIPHAAEVRRELPFTARFRPAEIADITGAKTAAGLENEFVVVQGVADLVVLLAREIWLVDFKTDDSGKDRLAEKIEIYRPQLRLYSAALEKIFKRPVMLRVLHFLAACRTERV